MGTLTELATTLARLVGSTQIGVILPQEELLTFELVHGDTVSFCALSLSEIP